MSFDLGMIVSPLELDRSPFQGTQRFPAASAGARPHRASELSDTPDERPRRSAR